MAFTVFEEGNVLGDWLKGELRDVKDYCRASVTVQAAADYATGTVLGKITATGAYTIMDPDASDGSQNAAAILIYGIEAESAADVENAGVLVRGPAHVYASKLAWIAGISDPEKASALAQLTALGILSALEA